MQRSTLSLKFSTGDRSAPLPGVSAGTLLFKYPHALVHMTEHISVQ